MSRAQYVTLTAEHDGRTYEGEFSVEAGTPAQTYGDPDDCYPAEGPSVDLIRVRELGPDGWHECDVDTESMFPDEDVLAEAASVAADEAHDR